MDPNQGVINATVALAVVTFLLVLVTAWLVWETRNSRIQGEHQRKEIAFRAALVEIADNIASLNRWSPALGMYKGVWWNHPLKFPKLTELLETVWIHPDLWERIRGGTLPRIANIEDRLNVTLINSQTAENSTAWQNDAEEMYHSLDLYLKQLARYVFCEMRRQGLNAPENTWNTATFQPRPWLYGDSNLPSETVADLFETQLIPPLSPEPNNAAFRDCRLQVLIGEARRALEVQPPMQLGK